MRIIDLSHEVRSGMSQRFSGPIPSIFDHSVRAYESFRAVSDSCVLQNHLGTHIDAPRHYDPEGGMAVHQLPLERLIVEAVVLDLTHKPPLSVITTGDLVEALSRIGESIRPNDGVLLHVGMADRFPTWKGEAWRDFEYARAPYLSEEAVTWLVGNRIGILGIDALAPDWEDQNRPAHQILLRDNNVPIVENLCNLEKIARPRVTFIALPPKIAGATGFLVRAVAVEW